MYPRRARFLNRTVHLDQALLTDAFVHQELSDQFALVTLKLNDVSVLRILNDASVAIELLLALLDHQLEVNLRVQSLHSRERFSAVSLLHANVDVVILHRVRGFTLLLLFGLVLVVGVAKVERFVRKGIVSCARSRSHPSRQSPARTCSRAQTNPT